MNCDKCGTTLNKGYYTCPACSFEMPIPQPLFGNLFLNLEEAISVIAVISLLAIVLYLTIDLAGTIIILSVIAAIILYLRSRTVSKDYKLTPLIKDDPNEKR